MVKKETKAEDNSKVIDKELGIDYSYLLNRDATDTMVVSPEEIAEEDNELIRSFLEANADIKTYIDKSIFDPKGAVASHIINLCKDKEYKVKVGEKEYRLAQAILIMVMSDCYNYVQSVAKALAEKSGNRNAIQLSDDDVYAIAENYFKHGGKSVEIKITNDTKKKSNDNKKAKTSAVKSKINTSSESSNSSEDSDDDFPFEIKDDEPENEPAVEENKPTQLSFFDL